MNTVTIRIAVERIAKYELALKWLDEYGSHFYGKSRDDFSLSFHPNYASACLGASEAKEVIDAFARFHIESIIKGAIANCRNTIEIDRETILREVQGSGEE